MNGNPIFCYVSTMNMFSWKKNLWQFVFSPLNSEEKCAPLIKLMYIELKPPYKRINVCWPMIFVY